MDMTEMMSYTWDFRLGGAFICGRVSGFLCGAYASG